MTDLGGTRALVTGGTDGLGRAMARALAEAGASVVLTSRDQTRAERVAAQLEGHAVGIALDVRDEAAVAAGVEDVLARLGGLELLVNNAGIGMRTVNPRFMTVPKPFWEVPPAGFRDVLETKATGCFLGLLRGHRSALGSTACRPPARSRPGYGAMKRCARPTVPPTVTAR